MNLSKSTGTPFQGGGCATANYGSYSSCPSCGVNAYNPYTWNAQDGCATVPELYTPATRCDYREKASRNRYDWKDAFDYGTNSSQCMYMGSINDTQASFPWGFPGSRYLSPSYGNYVGDADRNRTDAYALGPNSCGYDVVQQKVAAGQCSQIADTPKNRLNNMSFVNLPFVSYQAL